METVGFKNATGELEQLAQAQTAAYYGSKQSYRAPYTSPAKATQGTLFYS
jgi:hypothetical protein